MLNAAVPKVNGCLPKLSSNAFGTTESRQSSCPSSCSSLFAKLMGYQPVDNLPAPALPSLLEDRGSTQTGIETAAKQKAAAAQAKAAEAQRRAEQAAQEMEDEARQMIAEQQAKVSKQFVAPAVAAISSLLIALCVAYAQLGAVLGPAVAAVTAALANSAGLAHTWKPRAQSIFEVINSQIANAKKKVTSVIDTVDDMVMGPLQKLLEAIDDLAEEQKPALDKLKKIESTLSVDIPDPSDLKKPLDGCEGMIDEFVAKAKVQVPDKIDDFVDATWAGRVASDSNLFNRYIVVLPVALVIIVNVSIGLLQVYIQSTMSGTESTPVEDREPVITESLSQRRLRGSVPSQLAESREGLLLPDLMPYISPALFQIAISVLQAFAAFALSQGPRLCTAVNHIIKSLETRVNGQLNNSIEGTVDAVFDKAFQEVKGSADNFFPKFKGLLGKLNEVQEASQKADGAMRAVKGLF
jgi:hypothetical protein